MQKRPVIVVANVLMLVFCAIILILAMMPEIFIAQTPANRERTKFDQKILATALAAYRVDQGAYPPMTMQPLEAADAESYWRGVPPVVGRTLKGDALKPYLAGLSLSAPLSDPFAATKGIGYRYYTDGSGWIIGSFGPDVDEAQGGDLLWDRGNLEVDRSINANASEEGVEAVYTSTVPQPSLRLKTGSGAGTAFTYDPTNGTISEGDMWRVSP